MLKDAIQIRLDDLLTRYPDKFDYGNARRVMTVLGQDEPDFGQLAGQQDWILYYNLHPDLKGRSFQDLKDSEDPFYIALKGIVQAEDGSQVSDQVLEEFFDSNFILELRDKRGKTMRPVDLSKNYRQVRLVDMLKTKKPY